jgi:protein AATF/BFR2
MQEGNKKKAEIETKATKNRKIRYIVHDKILNFLTPNENLHLAEGRDAIVSNLFGGSTKRVKKVDRQDCDSGDDVKLL